MVKEELQDIILYQQSSAKAPTCKGQASGWCEWKGGSVDVGLEAW